MAKRAPFPTEREAFEGDERVSYDMRSQTYKLEDELGEEWEWLDEPCKWVPVTDEALVEQQQSAYIAEEVDESARATQQKKRKATNGEDGTAAKKQKSEEAPQKNKAIYITSLPTDVTEDELYATFSKFGVIAESAEGDKPRIKLYYDDNGVFKGDALIVYFRPESVQLAIDMLDESDFRLGQPVATGPMRVREADASFKAQKDKPLASEQAKKKGTGAYRDRQKVIKKNQEMNSRLADWDEDDVPTMPDRSSRWDKVVVLKHMFTLEGLAKDPAEILEIKEDVREEGEKFGTVTNVVLYDKEEEGVVTMRFGNATAAEACARAFDGRWFDGRRVEAYIADGRERFRKSGKHDTDDDEAARLESYGRFIEGEGEGVGEDDGTGS